MKRNPSGNSSSHSTDSGGVSSFQRLIFRLPLANDLVAFELLPANAVKAIPRGKVKQMAQTVGMDSCRYDSYGRRVAGSIAELVEVLSETATGRLALLEFITGCSVVRYLACSMALAAQHSQQSGELLYPEPAANDTPVARHFNWSLVFKICREDLHMVEGVLNRSTLDLILAGDLNSISQTLDLIWQHVVPRCYGVERPKPRRSIALPPLEETQYHRGPTGGREPPQAAPSHPARSLAYVETDDALVSDAPTATRVVDARSRRPSSSSALLAEARRTGRYPHDHNVVDDPYLYDAHSVAVVGRAGIHPVAEPEVVPTATVRHTNRSSSFTAEPSGGGPALGGAEPLVSPELYQQILSPLVDQIGFNALRLQQQQQEWARSMWVAKLYEDTTQELERCIDVEEEHREQLIELRRRDIQFLYRVDQLVCLHEQGRGLLLAAEAQEFPLFKAPFLKAKGMIQLKGQLQRLESEERAALLAQERKEWPLVFAWRDIEIDYVDGVNSIVEEEEAAWLQVSRRLFIIFETVVGLDAVRMQELFHREVIGQYYMAELRALHENGRLRQIELTQNKQQQRRPRGHREHSTDRGYPQLPQSGSPDQYQYGEGDDKKKRKSKKSFWTEEPSSSSQLCKKKGGGGGYRHALEEEFAVAGIRVEHEAKHPPPPVAVALTGINKSVSPLRAPRPQVAGRVPLDDTMSLATQRATSPPSVTGGDIVTNPFHLKIRRAPVPDNLSAQFAGIGGTSPNATVTGTTTVLQSLEGQQGTATVPPFSSSLPPDPPPSLCSTLAGVGGGEEGEDYRNPCGTCVEALQEPLGARWVRILPLVFYKDSSRVQAALRAFQSRKIVAKCIWRRDSPETLFLKEWLAFRLLLLPGAREKTQSQLQSMLTDPFVYNRSIRTVVTKENLGADASSKSRSFSVGSKRFSFAVPALSSLLKDTIGPRIVPEDRCRRCSAFVLAFRDCVVGAMVATPEEELRVEEWEQLPLTLPSLSAALVNNKKQKQKPAGVTDVRKEQSLFYEDSVLPLRYLAHGRVKRVALIRRSIVQRFLDSLCPSCLVVAKERLSLPKEPSLVQEFFLQEPSARVYFQNPDAVRTLAIIQASLRCQRAVKLRELKFRKHINSVLFGTRLSRFLKLLAKVQLEWRRRLRWKGHKMEEIDDCVGCLVVSMLEKRLYHYNPNSGKKYLDPDTIRSSYGEWVIGSKKKAGPYCKRLCFERYGEIVFHWRKHWRHSRWMVARLEFVHQYRKWYPLKTQRFDDRLATATEVFAFGFGERNAVACTSSSHQNRQHYIQCPCSIKCEDLLDMCQRVLRRKPGVVRSADGNPSHSFHIFQWLICKRHLFCVRCLAALLQEARARCRYATFVKCRFQFAALQLFRADFEYKMHFSPDLDQMDPLQLKLHGGREAVVAARCGPPPVLARRLDPELRFHRTAYTFSEEEDSIFCKRCLIFITSVRHHLTFHPELSEKRVRGYTDNVCNRCRTVFHSTVRTFLHDRRYALFGAQRWMWRWNYSKIRERRAKGPRGRAGCEHCTPLLVVIRRRVEFLFERPMSEYEREGYLSVLCSRCASLATKLFEKYAFLRDRPEGEEEGEEEKEQEDTIDEGAAQVVKFSKWLRAQRKDAQTNFDASLVQATLRAQQSANIQTEKKRLRRERIAREKEARARGDHPPHYHRQTTGDNEAVAEALGLGNISDEKLPYQWWSRHYDESPLAPPPDDDGEPQPDIAGEALGEQKEGSSGRADPAVDGDSAAALPPTPIGPGYTPLRQPTPSSYSSHSSRGGSAASNMIIRCPYCSFEYEERGEWCPECGDWPPGFKPRAYPPERHYNLLKDLEQLEKTFQRDRQPPTVNSQQPPISTSGSSRGVLALPRRTGNLRGAAVGVAEAPSIPSLTGKPPVRFSTHQQSQ